MNPVWVKETQDAKFSFRLYLQEQLQLWASFKPAPHQSNVGDFAVGEVQHSQALCLKAIVWAFQSDRTSTSEIIRVGAGKREKLILQMEL